MNVITFASRRGAVGKSTLIAHISAFAHMSGRRCLVIDADPQASLTLWRSMRANGELSVQNAARGIDRLVTSAQVEGVERVFIDTGADDVGRGARRRANVGEKAADGQASARGFPSD